MSHELMSHESKGARRDGLSPETAIVVPPRRLFLTEIAAAAAGTMLLPGAVHAAKPKPRKKTAGPVPRVLRLYNPNTKESWTGAYHDGRAVLAKAHETLNWFLRDHHEQQETRIDPATLDLLWRLGERYRRVGHGRVTINVSSAYRTKATNDRLVSEGAARNSQHLLGKAVDVTVQGYGIYFLIRHAERIGAGGVGLYWRGRFVHLDSGPRRYWYSR